MMALPVRYSISVHRKKLTRITAPEAQTAIVSALLVILCFSRCSSTLVGIEGVYRSMCNCCKIPIAVIDTCQGQALML